MSQNVVVDSFPVKFQRTGTASLEMVEYSQGSALGDKKGSVTWDARKVSGSQGLKQNRDLWESQLWAKGTSLDPSKLIS